METETIRIGARRIGAGEPAFVIAEAGVNHNGDLELAHRLVDAAADAGVDAVKFQTFRADRLVTRSAPRAAYQVHNTGSDASQHEMLRRLELAPDAHERLMRHCEQRGIMFLSTPFDEESADLLDGLGVPAFKLPSGEVTNLPLLTHVARFGRPVILSTGMAWLGEVETALHALRRAGAREVVLLHCVSTYPAEPSDTNLRAMGTLARAFGVPVGYSDHTLGLEVPLASVALGAVVVEKHITLDRSLPGPDHRASLEPGEFAELVGCIRVVEAALGHGRKEPAPSEADTARVARRSLVASRPVAAGDRIAEADVAVMRPGTGLPAAMLRHVLGRRALRDLEPGELLSFEVLG